MAFYSGKRGKVMVGTDNMRVQGWGYDPKDDLQDITNSEDEGFERFQSGIGGATVTFNAVWDPANEPIPKLQPGKEVVITLYAGDDDQTEVFKVNAIIEGTPVVSEVKGMLKFTCNARQQGPPLHDYA